MRICVLIPIIVERCNVGVFWPCNCALYIAGEQLDWDVFYPGWQSVIVENRGRTESVIGSRKRHEFWIVETDKRLEVWTYE